MATSDFTITFLIDRSPNETFNSLTNVRGWWSGLYSEEIEGNSKQLGDEFTFRAGNGLHYSKQRLIELIQDKKIVWLVTDSKLSFLEEQNEWTGTKLCFEISRQGHKTQVRFIHIGLAPDIECYDACSSAWTEYLKNFLSPLVAKVKE